MSFASRHNLLRRGMTLVELLVVVGIMMMLVAIAIPAIQPSMETRRLRAATRSINVYFGAARVRAMETGRPCGVLLERFANNPDACLVLRQVEVPEPYAGDDASGVKVAWLADQIGSDGQPVFSYYRVLVPMNGFAYADVRRGDLMQLNNQGPLYRIVDYLPDNNPAGRPSPPAASGNDFRLKLTDNPPQEVQGNPIDFYAVAPQTDNYLNCVDAQGNGGVAGNDGFADNRFLTLALDRRQYPRPPWPAAPSLSARVAFQIFSQPRTTSSAAAPLQLPRDVAIDLWASGSRMITSNPPLLPPDHFYACNLQDDSGSVLPQDLDQRPVIVMFSPSGSIESAYRSYYDANDSTPRSARWGPVAWSQPIFLLVGRLDRMGYLDGKHPVIGGPRAPGPTPEDLLSNWRDLNNLWLVLNPQTGQITAAANFGDATRPDGTAVPSRLDIARHFALETQQSSGGGD